ncbi:cell wall-active antibiotics response protein LiaF [Lederbergia sp. NSJ-179]|uniref:cell wall-active antibiotics response protein LiaF n=1 Tax=Lederbergia sp. NSJ-179 TaxID=2931402 RepID=UPI001FD60F2C|nr:cell wall-active antibiotics response protein LiaF [Lederbergia sp. NSJ-179]MCJ7841477.1 cell wall-active antibiotics response protein LiaF [Lederbergia sp. NSJ-179]
MKKLSQKSRMGWFMLLVATGITLELLLNWKLFVPLLIGCFLIYYGLRKARRESSKVYFIIGLLFAIIPIMSTSFFKLFMIVAVIYGLIQYSKAKKQPQKRSIETVPPGTNPKVNRKIPYIKNRLTGNQRIVNQVFEWDDINIQCGFGNTIIDLGMTMLPPGDSIVLIRGFIGNIQLLVPFDASITVNHSTISGKLKVFNHEEELLNSNVIYYTDENDEEASRRIKIITNVAFGDVEVRRT